MISNELFAASGSRLGIKLPHELNEMVYRAINSLAAAVVTVLCSAHGTQSRDEWQGDRRLSIGDSAGETAHHLSALEDTRRP